MFIGCFEVLATGIRKNNGGNLFQLYSKSLGILWLRFFYVLAIHLPLSVNISFLAVNGVYINMIRCL